MTTATRKKFAPKSATSAKRPSATRKGDAKPLPKSLTKQSQGKQPGRSEAHNLGTAGSIPAPATNTSGGVDRHAFNREGEYGLPARENSPTACKGPLTPSTSGDTRTATPIARPSLSSAPLTHDDEGLGLGWTFVALLYAIVWVVTYKLAANHVPLAWGIALAFVIVPGVYMLVRNSVHLATIARYTTRMDRKW